MRTIFEEYGKVIIAIFVVVSLLGIIFGGIHIYKVMGEPVNVETVFNHSGSEEAVGKVSQRSAPTISIPSTNALHVYTNKIFDPVNTVKCWDAEGVTLTPEITSILFVYGENQREELIEYYKSEEYGGINKIDLSLLPNELKTTGSLTVKFKVVDSYNIVALKTISYAVDSDEALYVES